ncbi:DUF7373 family lipoprotein [Nocardia goodfellowii]|uniref:Uncharacterized protein n=1 Tax=Nocardia goodfellowii TaxID=882446 RepID=A0ABS4Q6M5_9NOCA|nr:hypothetical protein [Nocardia goodfellowii]MBP2187350.1 hypothetical protein [Nocardia goodfellowii]
MPRGSRAAVRVRCAAFVLLLSGCATVQGQALPGMTPVDLARLNIGVFEAKPVDRLPEVADRKSVFQIESRRMLGSLVAPYEVDGELGELMGTHLLAAGEPGMYLELGANLPPQFQPVFERNYFMSGAMTTRSNGNPRTLKGLAVGILRFPSDAMAQTAATELDAATGEFKPDRHGIAVPNHPQARASGAEADRKGYVYAARGPFVVLAMVTSPVSDANALAAQFKRVLDLQFPKLDKLVPTPVDDILDLPTNPDAIMRRALPTTSAATDLDVPPETIGVFDPAAHLHYERDGALLKQVFADTGVDLVARNAGIVYRTTDLAAAFELQNALTELGPGDEAIGAPPGIADAACVQLDQTAPPSGIRHLCAVVYGRYVAVVGSRGKSGGAVDPTLYQRAAAQYSILAKSEQ